MTTPRRAGSAAPPRPPLPGGVVALGLVSLLMDASSELIHSVLPLLLVSLGAGAVSIGLIEGLAEATAMIVKLFSGALSDAIGKRKPLLVAGYGLAALSKPLFPLASSVSLVLLARLADRVGKGIRGAPRDALIADLTPPEVRGAAFGLRQSLDSVGAVVGPVAAIGLMLAFADDLRAVLWIAVLPAVLALVVLVAAVREPPVVATAGKPGLRFADLGSLSARYWAVVAIGAVVTLARFSEAFLILRATGVGVPMAWAPMVLVLMNVVYAATSYPAGRAADRIDRRWPLAASLVALAGADLLLALLPTTAGVLAGATLWGLHMGLSQGLLSHLVADASPAWLRGSAFGIFNLVSGVMLLVASVLAGGLWELVGPASTFVAGAAFCAVALAGLALVARRGDHRAGRPGT